MQLGIHIRNSEFSMVFVLVETMERAVFGNWKFFKVEKIVQSQFRIPVSFSTKRKLLEVIFSISKYKFLL